jgi:hypothetical protein
MGLETFTISGKASRPSTTFGDMRTLGIRRLHTRCLNPWCRHEVRRLIGDNYPNGMTVASLGARMICKHCNQFGAEAWPDWNDRSPVTGNQWR